MVSYSKIATAAQNEYVNDQQKTINVVGTVIDQTTQTPLPGATILIKGTSSGVVSDENGTFQIDAPEQGVLIVTCIGYADKEVKVAQNLRVVLAESSEFLDEIVVVGYSSQKRESLTGALKTLKSDKITNITTPNVENMLNGKVPGVFVASGSGQPGSSGKIIIRGKSTINGSTDPLWVVDGVIIGSSSGALNPADIESMTLLKDAASTAIYGSQGANGVIVVTTKKAKTEGNIVVNASAKVGITQLNNGNIKMMNGAQLYDYYSSFQNAKEINFARWSPELRNDNYDWWDLASQTGVAQDYNISLSGGTKN
jgi:TonB-dependent outer membrane receptor, SusC/RagA subfamily, signature region